VHIKKITLPRHRHAHVGTSARLRGHPRHAGGARVRLAKL
jgi:hypothetical protein